MEMVCRYSKGCRGSLDEPPPPCSAINAASCSRESEKRNEFRVPLQHRNGIPYRSLSANLIPFAAMSVCCITDGDGGIFESRADLPYDDDSRKCQSSNYLTFREAYGQISVNSAMTPLNSTLSRDGRRLANRLESSL